MDDKATSEFTERVRTALAKKTHAELMDLAVRVIIENLRLRRAVASSESIASHRSTNSQLDHCRDTLSCTHNNTAVHNKENAENGSTIASSHRQPKTNGFVPLAPNPSTATNGEHSKPQAPTQRKAAIKKLVPLARGQRLLTAFTAFNNSAPTSDSTSMSSSSSSTSVGASPPSSSDILAAPTERCVLENGHSLKRPRETPLAENEDHPPSKRQKVVQPPLAPEDVQPNDASSSVASSFSSTTSFSFPQQYEAKLLNLPLPPHARATTPVTTNGELGVSRVKHCNPTSPFLGLPETVQQYIFSLLDIRSLGRVARVCQYFRGICDENAVWQQVWQRRRIGTGLSSPDVDKRPPGKGYWKSLVRWQWDTLEQRWRLGKCRTDILRSHDSMVHCVKLRGHTVASGSEDATIRVWRLAHSSTKQRSTASVVHYKPTAVLSSPHDGPVRSLLLDGRHLLSGSKDRRTGQGVIREWDLKAACSSGKDAPSQAMKGSLLTDTNGGVLTLASLVHDKLVLAGSEGTSHILGWDLTTGAAIAPIAGHARPVREIHGLPGSHGKVVSVSEDSCGKIFDIRMPSRGACVAKVEGHTAEVLCAAALDDRVIMTGSSDQSIRLWDLASIDAAGKVRCTTTIRNAHGQAVRGIACDGHKAATGGCDGVVMLWDLSLMQKCHGFTSQADPNLANEWIPWVLTVSMDETRLVASYGSLVVVRTFAP